MILYPTETLYALGVNAFDKSELQKLADFKGRGSNKHASVLVRSIEDIEHWALVSETARIIAESFLPGSLTLVLPLRPDSGAITTTSSNTLGFRISPDPVAQQTIAEYMSAHDAPLTCTSANVSGQPPQSTVPEILAQFGEKGKRIKKIIDDGPRSGTPSTVVEVIDEKVIIYREGAIAAIDIHSVC